MGHATLATHLLSGGSILAAARRTAGRATLPAWRAASAPLRAARAARDAAAGDCPVAVLFYHRVADRDVTPWTMTNAEFVAQIDHICARYEVISLAEARRRLVARTSPRPAVVLTFDDGYRENLDAALPLLLERRLPVTYFVTTDHVRSGEPFPHDAALGHRFPVHTIDEVRQLHAAGVDVGVHTRSHADLGRARDPRTVEAEVAGAAADLTDWLGPGWLASRPSFAFPYGQRANLSVAAAAVARRIGLSTVVSAYGGMNRPSMSDGFHLLRFHADRSLARTANWLADDPRWWPVRPTLDGVR